MQTREVIILKMGAGLGRVAIADLPWHRLTAEVVSVERDPLPLGLALAIAEYIAAEKNLPIAWHR